MYTLYLLIDIVYVYHSSHVNKYEANMLTGPDWDRIPVEIKWHGPAFC